MPAVKSIRRAYTGEVPNLTEIRRDAILKLASVVMGDADASHWADSATADRIRRAIAEHEVWIFEQDGALDGWVEVDKNRIAGLYVSSDSSRRGVGSALLAHAESQIQAAGHAIVALDASPNAETFYLRRGYRRRGERCEDGSQPMRKDLPERRPTTARS